MTRRAYPDMHGWSNTWKPMNLDSHVDQFKKKKGTISINAEKASDELQCHSRIKTLNKMQPEGNSTTRRELNDQTESTYGKPTAKQRTQWSDRCSPRDKRRGGQTDAPPESRGGAVRPMLPQRQEEGWSDQCFLQRQEEGQGGTSLQGCVVCSSQGN